jgi:hypothetical protein
VVAHAFDPPQPNSRIVFYLQGVQGTPKQIVDDVYIAAEDVVAILPVDGLGYH